MRPDELSSATVNKKIITLIPTNIQQGLTITININDKLANYYFGKPLHKTFIDKFAGYSYLIEANFPQEQDNNNVVGGDEPCLTYQSSSF